MASEYRLGIVIDGQNKGALAAIDQTTGKIIELQNSVAVANATTQKGGEVAEQAGGRYAKMGAMIGSAIAGGVAAITSLTYAQIQFADSVGKMAERLGVSTEALSALGFAAEMSDATVQELDGGLQRLSTNLSRAAGGGRAQAALFRSMGVEILDTAGKVRPLDEVLGDIAERFSSYRDGPEKAALANKLFGASGEALIPMLNQGKAGLRDMSEQAERLGRIVGSDTARAAAEFNDNVSLLWSNLKGIGLAIATDVLPTLVALTNLWVDSGTRASASARDTHVIGDALREVAVVALIVKNSVEQMWEGFARGVEIASIGSGSMLEKLQAVGTATLEAIDGAASGSIDAISEAVVNGRKQFDLINREGGKAIADSWDAGAANIAKDAEDIDRGIQKIIDGFVRFDDTSTSASAAAGKVSPPLLTANRLLDEQNRALQQAQRLYRQLIGEVDPLSGEMMDYADTLNDLREMEHQGTLTSEQFAEAQQALAEAHRRNVAEIERRLNPERELLQSMDEEIRLLGLSNSERRVEEELLRLINEHKREGRPLSDQEVESLRGEIAARQATIDTLEYQRDAANQYQQEISSGFLELGDVVAAFATGQIKSLRDAWRAVVDDARRTVQQLLATWLKLNVLQPFLRNLFGGAGGGGTGGLFASLAGAFGGGGTGGTGLNSFAGLLGAGTGGQGAGFNYTSLLGAGNGGSLSGFFAMGGSGANAGLIAAPGGGFVYANPAAVGPPTALSNGGALGGFGTAAAGLGGAYYGYSRTNGGAAGLGAAASYGALGIGIAGTAAGVAGGAGVAAAAGGAFSSLGAAAAIPVVGWILAALAVVDLISGGKLFGTKFKPKSFEQGFNLTEDGGSAFLRVNETRQRALFGGTARRTRNLDAGAEANAQARDLYRLGETAGDDVGLLLDVGGRTVASAFTRVLDKKGQKVKEEYSTFFGVKYHEDVEAYATRVQAEAKIATVDGWLASLSAANDPATAPLADAANPLRAGLLDLSASVTDTANEAGATLTGEAHAIAERWRSNADQLAQGAEFLVAAAVDMKNAQNLLGDSGTLTQVTDLIEDMQRGGETLNQTYTRVRSSVELLETAVDLANASLADTREEFIQFAVDIVDAAGGLQQAQQLWDNFYKNFYGAGELTTRQLTDLFKTRQAQALEAGVDPNISFGAFRELFEERLPTASAETVAAMLRFASTMVAVRDAVNQLAAAELRYQDFLSGLQDEIDQANGRSTGFAASLRGIRNGMLDAITNADALARAAGRQGASERELALIHRWAASQVEAAIRKLQDSASNLVRELGYDQLSQVESQIAQMEAAYGRMTDGAVGGIDRVGQATDRLYEQQVAALQSLRDSLDETLVGDLSPLAYEDQLIEARRQLEAVAARAQSGDVDAINQFREMRLSFLRFVRQGEASGNDYEQQYAFAQGLADRILAQNISAGAGDGGGSVQLVPSPELRELYAQRDQLLADQEAQRRAGLANDLANHLRDLANATGETIFQVAERLGVDMGRFVTDLGGVLGTQTVETTAGLASIANILNVELSELADGLDIELGELRDAGSLMNDSFEAVLATLPEVFRTQLEPLLRDVENAASTEESAAALRRLNDATALLPEALRLQLAPYLDEVDPYTEEQLGQLDFLESVDSNTAHIAELLQAILDQISGTPGAGVVPGQGRGANPITGVGTGPALPPGPDEGEAAPSAPPVDVTPIVEEVGRLREEVARLNRLLEDNQQSLNATLSDASRSSADRITSAIEDQTRLIGASRTAQVA